MSSGAVHAGDLICVTGANGFIASHLVGQLLAAGYRVRGTVRKVDDPEKVDHLKALAESCDAADRLSFAAADLMEAGSFDEGMREALAQATPEPGA